MSEDYDLEVLLDLRETEKDDAEAEYAQELSELERRKKFLEKKKDELDEVIAQQKEEKEKHSQKVRDGKATPADAGILANYLRGLRQDERDLEESVKRAKQSVAQQEKEVDKAKKALMKATRELKAVEQHKEKWEAEQEQKARRKQSAAMDEIASRRWMEKNS